MSPKINEEERSAAELSKAIQESLNISTKQAPDSLTRVRPTDETVTDLQLITMPPIIPAFSMRKRAWGFYLIDGISEIKWNPNAYEALQMDQKQKDSVRMLVREHRDAGSGFDDFVSGKGRGLVFLLHGPPGSGKTMTAGMVFRANAWLDVADDTRNRCRESEMPTVLHDGRRAWSRGPHD